MTPEANQAFAVLARALDDACCEPPPVWSTQAEMVLDLSAKFSAAMAALITHAGTDEYFVEEIERIAEYVAGELEHAATALRRTSIATAPHARPRLWFSQLVRGFR